MPDIPRVDLTDEDVHEFIRKWKEEFKETVSFMEAKSRAEEVLALCSLISQPLPGGDPLVKKKKTQ